jgi:hypothetical protein
MEYRMSNEIKDWAQTLYEHHGIEYPYDRAIMETWPYLIFNCKTDDTPSVFTKHRTRKLFDELKDRIEFVRGAAGLGDLPFVLARVHASTNLFVAGFSSKEDAAKVKSFIPNSAFMTVALAA